jgi:DNA-binding CsgD family transcriptional regulator/PAS domain-containing protein
MGRMDDILQVTERLYAAAAVPGQWRPALEGVVDLLNADHATLDVHDSERIGAAFVANARLDERDLAALLSADTIGMCAPLVAAVPLGIATRQAIVSDAEFERSAVYNEFVRPLGGFHSLQFRRNGTDAAFLLTVCRPQRAGNFDAAEAAALRAIAPHLETALMLQRRLQSAAQGRAALARVLDRLDGGVILTDAAARPLTLNARAERIIAQADGLALDIGGLAAATPAATRDLRTAIAAMARDTAVAAQRMRLERPSRRLPLLLTVLPIWRLGLVLPGVAAPRVAIFISEPDAPLTIDRVAIAESFHLTRRETEIAAELADGSDLEAIAVRLGLGIGTARNHLKRVFEKTGTRSQPALVALLRGFVDRLH